LLKPVTFAAGKGRKSGMGKTHGEIIHRSHKRSEEFGIQKQTVASRKILTPVELKKILKENTELLDVTIPVMEELYEFLNGSGFIIILTDRNGCILEVNGDSEPLEEARKLNMIRGAYMDEKSIGTNAMGTAISENCPVQVTATEHFISAFHKWTCSAAPIHDLSGEIAGVLNLTGSSRLVHPHTLGLVVEAVSAIENSINNASIQKQLHNSNQFAFSMMNNLAYGLFAMDLNDDILWVNDTACRSINIRRLHLINIPIDSIFTNWKDVKEKILRHEPYIDEEGRFNIPRLKEKYIFSAYLIRTKEGEIIGYLLAFREYSGILKMINQYAGHSTRYTFDDLVGESEATQELIRYCKTVARNPTTVLITGETGTGKEIIAQSIHHASPRHDAAFVAVNCGAISETLIESELFGYVEGAFTGAVKGGRPGKFELADNGTLFLDEIGEMPMDMQVKLLRTIQEKAVIRVGSDKPIPVNVRIIAATNKNLEEEVEARRFRLDLYYRLNVIEVKVPPLRDRRDDIELLIHHFLKRKAAKFEIPIPEIRPEMMNLLISYDWPGNVRELENLMERAVILEGNIPESSFVKSTGPAASTVDHTGEKTEPMPESWNLEDLEKTTIRMALNHFGNNVTRIAEALGLSRNTLYLKMKKYQIPYKE
jgi:sigma-54 dependent transcriptional regulator, acetoin dehydrogenase operon transcriptional activator AcoR